MSAVQDAYGPTLPELLGARRWRVVRVVLIAIAMVVIVLAVVNRTKAAAETVLVGRGALEFNFVYDPPLRKASPAKVETVVDGVFVQSMQVTPITLPAYSGDAGGTLPIVADRLTGELDARYDGFHVVDEGRARVNDLPGYFIAWEAKLGERKLFARDYLLFPDEPGVREGARLQLMSTYAGKVTGADMVGTISPLKRSLRSFRFGTERP